MSKGWLAIFVMVALGADLAQAQAPLVPNPYAAMGGYPYGVVPAGYAPQPYPAYYGSPQPYSTYGPTGLVPANLPPYGPPGPPAVCLPQSYNVKLPPRKPFCDCDCPRCFDNSLECNTPNAFDMDCPTSHHFFWSH